MGHFLYCQRFNSVERKQSHKEARLNIIILSHWALSEMQPLRVTITFYSLVYPVLFFQSRVLSVASLTQSTTRDLLPRHQLHCFDSGFFLSFFDLSQPPTTQSQTARFRHLSIAAGREPQSFDRVFFCVNP